MASAATVPSPAPQKLHPSDISSIKDFAESIAGSAIPSTYHSITEGRDDVADELAASLPVIDLSLLTSTDPVIHAGAVRELGRACQDWGFFLLINHGISESLIEDVVKKSLEFHNLPFEEKNEFNDEGMFAPIRYGTSALPHGIGETVHYWRDYLKITTFPEFNFPNKPPGFKEVGYDYSRKIRAAARTLLQGISESLGLEPNTIVESTNFDSGFQKFQVNLYPPCPQPDLTLGLPAHTDNGFLTLLIQNGIGGLQLKHEGKWVNVTPLPNCIIVNTGDQLEVVSNGRYKSIWHRVVVNERVTRVSLALGNGPPYDQEIGPLPQLLEKEKPVFRSITYREFLKLQQKVRCDNKPRGLEELRIKPQD
ncbi:flavanone 3-dioxygenase 2 [Neltuma alba]|uniref:flavanone 3-dioxygenase 2 n=1 Tax=Neltuma alba TaxID=207710 RepID=UPI0010A3BB16|nr:flavanone 3-dioxygenase 2-like [Prosopis alba]